jgi:hypothetical protein
MLLGTMSVTRTCFLLDTKSPALLGSLHAACTRRLFAPVSIFRFVDFVLVLLILRAIDRVRVVGQGLDSVVVGIRVEWWWNVRRIQYNCEGVWVLLVLGFGFQRRVRVQAAPRRRVHMGTRASARIGDLGVRQGFVDSVSWT